MKPRTTESPETNPCLAAALNYAERGWKVFPLDGKKPFAGTRAFRDATNDPAVIKAWWKEYPAANVGIVCSSTDGPIVIDIDGPSGEGAIKELDLPETREVRSRKRHRHLYFAPPEDGTTVKRAIRPRGKDYAFDVLSDGGYVVGAPSVHPDTGQRYECVREAPLAPFPPSAQAMLRRAADIRRSAKASSASAISDGERNNRLTSFAGSLRSKGEDAESILEVLRNKNERDCDPPLDDDEVRKIAYSVAKYEPAGCIVEQSATLRAVANIKRRVKSAVMIYALADLDKPLVIDTFDLASHSRRERFVALLEGDRRGEATELLAKLAATAAALPAKRAEEAAEVEPFKPVKPWKHTVDVAQLLGELCTLIQQYIVLPKYGVEAIALWIAHTYVIDAADFTPYLHITSPVRECGKSTLLDLLAELAHRSQMSGGITAAALYRRIDRLSPTVLLDELDTRLRDEGGDFLKRVLNTGFGRRQGSMTICVGDDNADKDFKTFSAKALASIGPLWDTVVSRSIPIAMQRASKAEMAGLIKIRGDRIEGTCLPFRRRLVRFSMDNVKTLRAAGDPPTPKRLSARQCDVWRPLFSIADLAGGRWPMVARRAALKLHAHEEETDRSLLLLRDLRKVFEVRGVPALKSEDIVAALTRHDESRWKEYNHGKPITARGVAKLLERFGVHPRAFRPPGESTARGYSVADLRPVFLKYLKRRTPAKKKPRRS